MTSTDLLVVSKVSKRFGPTVALDDVSVAFRAGEVHALMGENGAGKSTLGKVIAGLHRQDFGTIAIADRELRPGSIDDAFHAGVRIVHQELAQCPNLSVAENLCLHDLPRRFGMVDRAEMHRRAARLLETLEPGIDVGAPLGSLAPGHRQIVQIASALDEREAGGMGARAIVFDEPTSSLSVAEVTRLLAIVRGLAARGLAVIYVSHRMGEIFEVCDRVTVLRDGRYVGTSVVSRIDEASLVEQMIGRCIDPIRAKGGGALPSLASEIVAHSDAGSGRAQAEVSLQVRGLSSPGRLDNISLGVRAGEILGVGGLVGAGRSELLDAIFGLDPRSRGEIRVCGQALAGEGEGGGGARRIARSIAAGLGYVPEDRKLQGLFFQLGIDENIVEPVMASLAAPAGLRRRSREAALVRDRLGAFQIKAARAASVPGELSGGNQQKVLLARWIGAGTRVLLLDEPTRGIDVGTKAEVYRIVHEAASRGVAVLLVSSEMPELLGLADRIVVLREGRLAGELRGPDMTQANVLRLAMPMTA
ncbi:MAG: sugar ABC transporter ATP-binding protein [Phycisphaerales bacterium]|nr:sugar ABC transporter ATP-binding protein [Phycisphaerales bacterium]